MALRTRLTRVAILAPLAASLSLAVRPMRPPGGTRVVVLGTGTPNADPERSGPAVAIVVGNDAYLVDAGPGIVRRAASAAATDSIPPLGNPHLKRGFRPHPP